MIELLRIVAAHPVEDNPYREIRFTRVDHNGTPLYRVGEDGPETGARKALKRAVKLHGANCFHCAKPLPPQDLSQKCTVDHLQPSSRGGGDHLHNLVVACGGCNRRKGARDIVAFHRKRGSAYLAAVDAHLARCLSAMKES